MINDLKDGSGERLKLLRKHLGLTQVEFSQRLMVSNGHISDMEKERKNITEPMIKLLCGEFNISDIWLRTGQGDMLKEISTDEELSGLMGRIIGSENQFIKDTMLALAKLDEKDWDFIKELMDKIRND